MTMVSFVIYIAFRFYFKKCSYAVKTLQSTVPLVQRCVVVTRQVDGYGLTVTGDHPVFVHTVKPNGAAFHAGVRQGDKILKVNGMPVTASNHLEVVRMISGGQTVALTLLGPPPEPLTLDVREVLQMRAHESKAVITEPILIENERKEEWKRKRVKIIRQMLEEERRHVESLRETSVEGIQLERALQRIESLQNQLRNIEPVVTQEKWMVNSGMHFVHPVEIITMEEETDDNDGSEIPFNLETQGPFLNFADLKMRPAHLAAFINYLLANANPSSVFFYLITDAYQNSNAVPKDLRKWAYEIFSTFLIPNSPLSWDNIDQSLIQSIDKILAATVQATDDDMDQLIKIFGFARKKSLDDINEHLANFRQKRLIGLGSLFDANQLAYISKGDTAMETRVGEAILIRSLENLLNSVNQDLENCESRSLAIISALATIIKVVLNMRSNTNEKILDRCPTFVTKDKIGMFKMKMASKRSIQVKGHQFMLTPVNLTVYCYQCRDAIWGVNAQAYFCQNCDVVVHKQCTLSLSDHCYPAIQKKTGANKTKRTGSGGKCETESFEGSSCLAEQTHSTSIIPDKELHRVDNIKSASSDSGIGTDMEKPVSRSQSMRSRADEMQDGRPGRSAFSWGGALAPPEEGEERTPRRARSDMDSEDKASPITLTRCPLDTVSLSGSSSILHASGADEEVRRLMDKIEKNALVETEVPSLESFVGWEIVRRLKPKEKKRQEILYKVFYKPMVLQNIVPPEVIKLFFPNLEELLEVHGNMSRMMRNMVEEWKRDCNLNGLLGDVGLLMEDLFDGENGVKLMEATATFCQHQQHALDILRQRCKKEKDDQLSRFLIEAEISPLCPVNTAKRNAENLRRLEELQKRLVTTSYDRENFGNDFHSFNLTHYKLIHDGPLTWRCSRNKMIELHVVLLENVLILLTKTGDGSKLLLKVQEPSKDTRWSPVLPLTTLIAKEKANDKRALFIVNTMERGAQIYELVTTTATERKTWFKLISDQIDLVKCENINAQPNIGPFGMDTTGDGQYHTDDMDFCERVQISTHPRLVSANEITIQQPTIFEHAQPILTPTERLRRNDELIMKALLDKQTILAEFLPGSNKNNLDELEKLTEQLTGMAVAELKQRDGQELAMSAIVHGNRLLDAINQGLSVRKDADDSNSGTLALKLDNIENDVPTVACYKLTAIAAPLMNHLKAMMQIIQDQQNEIKATKQQLHQYKELANGINETNDKETITENIDCKPVLSDAETERRKRLQTKRQRNTAVTLSAASIYPHSPTNS
uniref:RhoGEF domain-containing protein n=1 Tax=Wuchereria bancrofti TaxID=6293 RepID=A0A1I8EMN9_WUCBA